MVANFNDPEGIVCFCNANAIYVDLHTSVDRLDNHKVILVSRVSDRPLYFGNEGTRVFCSHYNVSFFWALVSFGLLDAGQDAEGVDDGFHMAQEDDS